MRKFLFPLVAFVLIAVATGLAPVFEPGAKAQCTYAEKCDYNCDGVVDLADVSMFASYFYSSDSRADLDGGGGTPNVIDVRIMAESYGTVGITNCCYTDYSAAPLTVTEDEREHR